MKLLAWRLAQELTQKELAALLRSDQGHVSDLETGKITPTILTIALVSKVTRGQVAWTDWAPEKKVWKKPTITTKKSKEKR